MRTADFDFELPLELIAQKPPAERDAARMLVLHRGSGKIEHRSVRDLPDYLCPEDLLVVNNTRVFPARIFGERAGTGGKVELLLVEELATLSAGEDDASFRSEWSALCRSGFKPSSGIVMNLAQGRIKAAVIARGREGTINVQLESSEPLFDVLETEGVPPVPPYIDRSNAPEQVAGDRTRYQTVYAEYTGAVAAPTAGLHFTPELLGDLGNRGIKRAAITLHVGPGTFRPVKVDRLEEHAMQEERYTVSAEAASAIATTGSAQGRVVAVGTTTVRTLETVVQQHGAVQACSGRSSLFIYPPYEFGAIGAMLTNFHLPKSTLIMMISAFAAPGEINAGREMVLSAYKEAVSERYRFYSYGDCMLIL